LDVSWLKDLLMIFVDKWTERVVASTCNFIGPLLPDLILF
jgi:hypothetical protein